MFLASLFFASAALAETEVASAEQGGFEVTVGIYGSFRPAVGVLNDGVDTGFNIFDRASRLGFRGTFVPQGETTPALREVFWQVESGIHPDEGRGDLAGRDTFLGARGDWGTAFVGFMVTPARRVGRRVEHIFGRAGDSRNIARLDGPEGGQDARHPGWDNRVGNSIAYISPRLAGFQGSVQYSSNYDTEFRSSSDGAPALSTSLTYEGDAVWIGVGHEIIDKDATVFAKDPEDFVGYETAEELPEATANAQLFRLAAALDLGPVIVSGLAQRAVDQQGVAGWDRDTFGGGVSYWATESVRLAAQAYRAQAMNGFDDSGATMGATEVEYRFAPTVRIYFSVAHTRNEANAQFHSSRGVLDDPGRLGRNSTSGTVTFRYDF